MNLFQDEYRCPIPAEITARAIWEIVEVGGTATGTLINSGTINANAASPLTISTANTVTNSGTLEATSGGDLVIDDSVKNFKIIEALGPGATVTIDGVMPP